jgi:chemotaxis receptor (MCP) glutamine deamidase CheD
VAERHIAFIRAYAEAEKMQIVEQDLGDDYAREVAVYPGVGTVQVSVLADSAAQAILADEETHLTALESTAPTGEVILF